MGMTDRQYDDRQKSLLRDLEDIKEEINLKTDNKLVIDKLERLISDTEDFLRRP